MNRWLFIFVFSLHAVLAGAGPALPLTPEAVPFRNGDSTLYGCVYRPAGKGPFPAVIFNQSATRPSYEKIEWPPFVALAQFFTTNGYVFFLPGRRNHEGLDAPPSENPKHKTPSWTSETDARNADVLAGMTWLKAQSYVDETRIVLCGHSAGGIQALLVAEKKPDIRGTITFSVGAISWKGSTALQGLLKSAVKNTDTPIFLLQPQNDYNIESSRILGDLLRQKGQPNRVKVFPPYGAKPSEANLFGLNGANIWGEDVLKFLREVTK